MRGYSPWPAKIIENINNNKYNVYFYGTGQTGARLIAKNIFNYVENKEKFVTAKTMKRVTFYKAVDEIENALPTTSGNSVVDGSVQKAREERKLKKQVRFVESDAEDSTMDYDSDNSDETSSIYSSSAVNTPMHTGFTVQVAAKNLLMVYIPTTESLGIKIDYGKPESFANIAAEIAWMKKAREEAIELKQQLETGQIDAESMPGRFIIDPKPEEIPKEEAERFFKELIGIEDTLLTERKFLQLSYELRDCLGFTQANVGRSLRILEDLKKLHLTQLMLMRTPESVQIIEKVRRYTGNIKIWKLNASDQLEFDTYAKKIRDLSTAIYDGFKMLINFELVPDNTFRREFNKQLRLFKKFTRNTNVELCSAMSQLTYNSLIKTQNVVNCF
ncbi:uncharacterized protein LOC117784991 [Drosophila innubila]|uniref:uncharacterized protein LOC117784991 n=1 Tax=Drosophila innubila TaxID=198719 RepID=UPI00148C1E0D|nr:uncharacterized protein LOC117784991 [Drosophila innubila]